MRATLPWLVAPWLAPRRAAPPRCADFASPSYWDDLYAADDSTTEWLLPCDAGGDLARALAERLGARRHEPVLELGCGSSDLACRLVADGWNDVTACDVSETAIDRARRLAVAEGGARARVEYVVADARRLGEQLGSGRFGAVVDKGLLDAVCSADGWDYEARLVSRAIRRVLRPGGLWVRARRAPRRPMPTESLMRGAARVVQVSIALMPPSALRLAIEPDAWAAFECEQLGSGLHVYTARSVCDAAPG